MCASFRIMKHGHRFLFLFSTRTISLTLALIFLHPPPPHTHIHAHNHAVLFSWAHNDRLLGDRQNKMSALCRTGKSMGVHVDGWEVSKETGVLVR